MVYFQTKNTNSGKFWRVLQWKMLAYLSYGNFVYFTIIWSILRTFGTFCGNFAYFSHFGILYREKSGKPGQKAEKKWEEYLNTRMGVHRRGLKPFFPPLYLGDV
jgi:hypothetical protein